MVQLQTVLPFELNSLVEVNQASTSLVILDLKFLKILQKPFLSHGTSCLRHWKQRHTWTLARNWHGPYATWYTHQDTHAQGSGHPWHPQKLRLGNNIRINGLGVFLEVSCFFVWWVLTTEDNTLVIEIRINFCTKKKFELIFSQRLKFPS